MTDIELEKMYAILKGINSAIKGKKLYPAGHPAIFTQTTKAYQALLELLKTNNKIFIGLAKDVLVFEENPIMDPEKNLGELIHRMMDREIEGIIFEKGLPQKEFFSFIDIISEDNGSKGLELQNILSSGNILHITIKSIAKRSILDVYNDAVNVVKETMDEMRMGKIPEGKKLIKITDELTEMVLSDRNAMIGLTMIKNYDNYLFHHSVNVSILSIALGEHMNHDKDKLHMVGIAGLLHDIGKTGVAEEIIRKPAGLSGTEWEAVKQHPVLGYRIIGKIAGMTELICRIVYEHHIKYDHSGYPRTESPLHPLSMIVTTTDAYDSLTTLRVYQRPYHPVEAIKIMNNLSGKHFDPDTLKAFIAMVGFYPIGTAVRLSTNDIGIVTKVNPDSGLSPAVKVIFGGDGKELPEPYTIDISKDSNAPSITGPVDPLTKGLDITAFFEGEARAAASVIAH